MTNKIKIVLSVLVLSVMFSSSLAFAQTTPSTTTTKQECITAALSARKDAVKAANTQYKTDRKTALDARTTAIKAAKTNTDKVAARAAIKTANTTYSVAVKTATKTRLAAVKAAYATEKTAKAACQ